MRTVNLSLGITNGALRKMSEREKFSDYLPYVAYDPDTGAYHNADGTIGYIWECTPLCYADQDITKTLEGLFRAGIPDGSVLQFILYADPYIEPIISHYQSLKKSDKPLLKKNIEEYARYLSSGNHGLENLQGIPLRRFRLFVALSIPGGAQKNSKDVRIAVMETLKGAYLFPMCLEPNELVRTLGRIFNDAPSPNHRYDERLEIRKQIIFSDTHIVNEFDNLRLGSKVVRVATPKTLPKESSILSANIVAGDIWGVISDNNQIKSPFIIAWNVIFENLKSMIHRKTTLVLQQQSIGSLAPGLARRKDEYLWAVDELEKGTTFLRVVPIVVVFGKNDNDAGESMMRAKRLWEHEGFVMQEDKGIVPILFLSSLPFGLYNVGNNVKMLDRDFVLPAGSVAEMLPIQADFQGNGEPQVPFIGRKGAIVGVDLFDSRAVNMNALVVGSSGGGKSFFVNHMVINYLASGTYVRIIDIGGSYRKLCKVNDGKYIEFDVESEVCLNPFSNVTDINDDLFMISLIISQMVYSFSNAAPHETEASLIKAAVRWAFERGKNDATIDTVYEYLNNYRQYTDAPEFEEIAKTLAYNLKEFTSAGTYGRWFCGKSTLDIKHDPMVVLELEHLKPKKELFKVVVLQVINYVTQDLYLSDRSTRRLIIFDEAWQFFKEGGFLGEVIEEGDRRARKYGGSFTKIVQSILDLKQFGSIGEVIRNNSAFKFYLQSEDWEKAKNEKLVDVGDFMFKIMKSVKANRPKYSEVFMETPSGVGVARLHVNKESYFLYTSDAKDNAAIEALRQQGMSYAEAILYMAKNAT